MNTRLLLVPVVALAGAGLAVLPTLAAGDGPPSTASFTAVDFAWDATGTSGHEVTVAAGGTVTFGYPSGGSEHNADFGGGPQPTNCTQTAGTVSGSVPPLPAHPTAPGWTGTCTFDTPGTYTFHCDLHPFMTGTIVVEAQTTTTTTTTTTTGATTTATTPTTTSGTTTATTPTTTTTTTTTGTTPTSTAPAGGSARPVIVVAAHQRGQVVRGLVRVPASALDGTLELALYLPRATVTRESVRARIRGLVRVGTAVIRLRHGVVRFAVALDRAARQALAQTGRLALVLTVVVRPPHSAGVALWRDVVLRR